MATINAGVGNTAAGSIVQLVAKGSMDRYLTSGSANSTTYWKSKYSRTTQFCMESVIQSFSSQVQFGQTSQITLNRTGDLVYYMYVLLELPGIEARDLKASSSNPHTMLRSQFPCGDGSVERKADASVYAEYCSDTDLPQGRDGGGEPSSVDINNALKMGKTRWLQEKYTSG